MGKYHLLLLWMSTSPHKINIGYNMQEWSIEECGTVWYSVAQPTMVGWQTSANNVYLLYTSSRVVMLYGWDKKIASGFVLVATLWRQNVHLSSLCHSQ